MQAKKTYYLDAEGNVTEDQAKAASILINKGVEIPARVRADYGFVDGEIKAKGSTKAAAPKESVTSVKPAAKAQTKRTAPKENK